MLNVYLVRVSTFDYDFSRTTACESHQLHFVQWTIHNGPQSTWVFDDLIGSKRIIQILPRKSWCERTTRRSASYPHSVERKISAVPLDESAFDDVALHAWRKRCPFPSADPAPTDMA